MFMFSGVRQDGQQDAGRSAQMERYEHHGKQVSVRSDLKGRHREHCLCYGCSKFKPDAVDQCPIAKAVFDNCVAFGIVSPVWECPDFAPKA